MLQKKKFLLAIETSCDESAAAVLDQNGKICSNIICSQTKIHALHGGIVPEIASREHLVKIINVTQASLKQAKIKIKNINIIAVTYGPGLIGSLLVGTQFAKGLAQSLSIPLIGIHHIEGHLMSGMVMKKFPNAPFIALVASGGHSAIYNVDKLYNFNLIGDTRDDAAGEAFDKIGRLLGFDYPAGELIDKYSHNGNINKYKFPIALPQKTILEYSFSGLKTSARIQIEKINKQNKVIKGQILNDICASVQKAIIDALLNKAFLACKKYKLNTLVFGGGVCANSLLRKQSIANGIKEKIKIYLPPKEYCTDNAVMIGLAAHRRIKTGQKNFDKINVNANALL